MRVLKDLGYGTHYSLLNAQNYGVAQKRERVYIVGFLKKTNFKFPKPTKNRKFIKDILVNSPVSAKLLCDTYLQTLRKAREG